jgi:hypothetical protein
MRELVFALIAWVSTNSGYDKPVDPPTVEYRTAAYFQDAFCASNLHCGTRAFYEDGTNTIVLHEDYRDINDPRTRAILVHEITHYLQDLSARWPSKNCAAWVAREQEAYRLQVLYLAKVTGNHHLHMPALNASACEGH